MSGLHDGETVYSPSIYLTVAQIPLFRSLITLSLNSQSIFISQQEHLKQMTVHIGIT